MNRTRSTLTVAALLLCIAATAFAERTHERAVPIERIPAAARETILREAAGNVIVAVKKVQEDGLNFLAATWMQAGAQVEIRVTFKGELL